MKIFNEKTQDLIIKNEIEILITEKIYKLQVNLIEKYIYKLENELESKNIENFENIKNWKDYKKFLLNLKNGPFIEDEEKIDILINKAHNLTLKIRDTLIKKFKIKQRGKSE